MSALHRRHPGAASAMI